MNQEQAENKAKALQSEVTKTYAHRSTGRKVKIQMINAELDIVGNNSYVVQVSSMELDSNLPHQTNLVEKAPYFFTNYIEVKDK